MKRRLYLALFLIGFTSLGVQTLLIREFLISFYGNELTIGIILANWIMFGALGSGLASRPSLKTKRSNLAYAVLQLGIAACLPLSIFLIRMIKNILGLTLGEGVGILPILSGSLLILAPLGLLIGAQFPYGCRMLSDISGQGGQSASKVYILDSLGFILAGPIVTYLLITKIDAFSVALIFSFLNLLSALFLLQPKISDAASRYFCIVIACLSIFALLSFFGPTQSLNMHSIQKQWKGQEVLCYKNSVYGNLTATRSGRQYTFYSDGIPIITTPVPDIAAIEELVHFTMLSHPAPKKVLLLGGGPGGVIHEITKYPLRQLTYVELDPSLIKLVKDFPTELTRKELDDPRLTIRYIDARRFLHMPHEKYDVVIVNTPIPSTLQLNRLYTHEFFKAVEAVLSEGGVLGIHLPGSLSYISPEMRNLNGSILNTLNDVFRVTVIPGDAQTLYIASKKAIPINAELFLARLENQRIETQLLNGSYLVYRLDPGLARWFMRALSGFSGIRKNFDLLPSGAFYSIAYWNALFSRSVQGFFDLADRFNFNTITAVTIILGILFLIFIKTASGFKRYSVGFAIATTGFAGMSLSLILIYAYQSFYGFVFQQIAVLTAAFMGGLTLGGWIMNRILMRTMSGMIFLTALECLFAGFCALGGVLLLFLNRLPSLQFPIIFFCLLIISGAFVGVEFPLVNKIYCGNKESSEAGGILYALDLTGAWIAALAVSVILVPVIGIFKTCIILAILKTLSAISLMISKA